jgi:hypothetical protein
VRRPRDPIAHLLQDLAISGAPSLEWSIRWSQPGLEPVAAAWTEAERSTEMLMLLYGFAQEDDVLIATHALLQEYDYDSPRRNRLIRDRLVGFKNRWPGQYLPTSLANYLDGAERRLLAPPEWQRCRAIRRAVPIPPTLTDLLTEREKRTSTGRPA